MVVLMVKCRLVKRKEGGRSGELRARLLREFVIQVSNSELQNTLTPSQRAYVDEMITEFSFH
jgi:hypothetical protein